MSTWIEHFTDTISQYFDTPRVLIEALGYWAVGAALGRRVYMEGGVPMFPNMFLIIVSPPGWFRKSTASKKALSIVRRIVGDQGILPNQASSEAFLESIENQDTGVLHFDEFRGYMQHMSKEYASQIHTWLMEMFETSGNHYKLKRAGKEAKSIYSNCLVSFLSTSTTAWLTSSMGKIEALSGFLPAHHHRSPLKRKRTDPSAAIRFLYTGRPCRRPVQCNRRTLRRNGIRQQIIHGPLFRLLP